MTTGKITRVRTYSHATRVDYGDDNEPDRTSVTANGVVVDVIANEDGSVYVEFYPAKHSDSVAVVNANIDQFKFRHPNVKVMARDWPVDHAEGKE